jgi:predicted metal-dependent peptidase
MYVLEDVSRITKQLILKEPFYGLFSSTLNKVIRQDVPTAGVSKQGINYQLAINEEFWNTLDNDNKKIGLIKHELLHICFQHLHLRTNYNEHELFNIAADIEINQYIDPVYYPIDSLLLPSSFPELHLPEKAGTRKYYELLQQAKQDGTSPSLDKMLEQGVGNGIGNIPAGDLHPTWKEFDNLSEADKKLIKAQLDHQIKNLVDGQKNRGTVPNELKSYIDSLFEIKPPSYDWKSYFRRFAGQSMKVYTKKTRRKLNKRFEENPALKIKFKKNILVAIDTSGSVSNLDLIEFFNEIHHMYKTGISITIAEIDAAIHNTYEYKGVIPEFVSGRGGTDMNPAVEYFNKHKEFNSLIILTDGFIEDKTITSFKPMLMVLCSNGAKIESVQEMNWGNVIKIQSTQS